LKSLPQRTSCCAGLPPYRVLFLTVGAYFFIGGRILFPVFRKHQRPLRLAKWFALTLKIAKSPTSASPGFMNCACFRPWRSSASRSDFSSDRRGASSGDTSTLTRGVIFPTSVFQCFFRRLPSGRTGLSPPLPGLALFSLGISSRFVTKPFLEPCLRFPSLLKKKKPFFVVFFGFGSSRFFCRRWILFSSRRWRFLSFGYVRWQCVRPSLRSRWSPARPFSSLLANFALPFFLLAWTLCHLAWM